MLLDVLKNNQCFKLILGLGNRDLTLIERLVYVYSKAGCNFFDAGPEESVLISVKRGLERACMSDKRFLCVSIGQKNDIHTRKAKFNHDFCSKCGKCISVCVQRAIEKSGGKIFFDSDKCIGCGKCSKSCVNSAIKMIYLNKNIKETLDCIKKFDVDCIELHISSENQDEAFELFEMINSEFEGIISICTGRDNLGNLNLIQTLKRMVDLRKPYTTIIQADGTPMSGGKDDFKSTLQAVACADIVLNEDINAFVIISGGTNSKSSELAKLCNVKINGVALGSFARKIVYDYLIQDDFYENQKLQEKAIFEAKKLIDNTLMFLN